MRSMGTADRIVFLNATVFTCVCDIYHKPDRFVCKVIQQITELIEHYERSCT